MRAVLTITVMMNGLFFPYQHRLPVFARRVLQVGPEWLGGLVAADGLGALLGALAIAGRCGFLPHGRLFAPVETGFSPSSCVSYFHTCWFFRCRFRS